MVDEFSTFARMPKAVMERQNLVEIVKEAMVLQRVGISNVDFDFDGPLGFVKRAAGLSDRVLGDDS